MKVAVFYPWIKSRGGSEKVVLEILKNKNFDSDLYTWVYDKEKTFSEFSDHNVNVIAPKFMQNLSKMYLMRGLFVISSLFTKINLDQYDLFLVYTSGMGEFVTFRSKKKGKTVAYVNTPLRAANKEDVSWNLKNRYKNTLKKALYISMVAVYSFLEKISWKNFDSFIFLSELSYNRALKKGLVKKKDFPIVYPPVSIYENLKAKIPKIKEGNYFLYVSRFNKLKRQDLVLDAWKEFTRINTNYKLVLAGGIDDKNYFKSILEKSRKMSNVEVKFDLSDKEIKEIYSGCLAGVFVPFREDFGIVPFEFLAMGKKLVAIDGGFYTEMIRNLKSVFLVRESEKKKEMVHDISEKFLDVIKSKEKTESVFFKELYPESFEEKFAEVLKKQF